MSKAETFVCRLYYTNFSITDTDTARCVIFRKVKKTPDSLSPTHDALNIHL